MQSTNQLEQQIEPRILEASKHFARSIVEAPPFQRFEQASIHLQDDPSARQLLTDFQQKKQSFQMQQRWGGTSTEEAELVERFRKQMLANPTLKEYFESQDEILLILKETNEYMTERLGFDFARFAKPTSGCC